MTKDRVLLRRTFDEEASLYDRARPHYPDALFDAIDRVAPGRRTLAIGCGTGQATLPLAARGYTVTAVELGAAMAEVANAKLASSPKVEVVNEDFESWDGPKGAFSLVVSATAFHWIDPTTRLDRVARALRPGGVFALVDTCTWREARSPSLRLSAATSAGIRRGLPVFGSRPRTHCPMPGITS